MIDLCDELICCVFEPVTGTSAACWPTDGAAELRPVYLQIRECTVKLSIISDKTVLNVSCNTGIIKTSIWRVTFEDKTLLFFLHEFYSLLKAAFCEICNNAKY